MEPKIIPSSRFAATHVLRFDKNDEVVETLTRYCRDHAVTLGTVSAIGAAGEITVGYFNTSEKKYHSQTFTGDLEITNISGNISTMNGDVYIHLHITFADEQCNAKAGHLNRAVVSGTLEMFINETDDSVDRAFSDSIGLNLLKL
ncbi:MAG: DNA-binding protein [Deltaproteobacteria bacterium]|nr:DNA-binding protein [Deltaproteobacteria bacterium]MBN2670064.1 DNA-binding protein [Deltaproteobacteria bacterium]